MNNGTKSAIKKQLINWIGVMLFIFVGFYFTAKTNIKYNENNIKDLKENTVQRKVYNEYIKRIDQLIESNFKLTESIIMGNKEDIIRIEQDIKDIKANIRSLYVNMGYKTRGLEMKTIE